MLTLLWVCLSPASGCENMAKPTAPGEGPDKSAVAPGDCEILCGRHAACLDSFRKVGAEPFFITPPDEPCSRACDATARDPLVGALLAQIIKGCAVHAGCDHFYGCALRLWLSHLSSHPWKRDALHAGRTARAVSEAVRSGRLSEAARLCGAPDTFGAMERHKTPAAVRAAKALAEACAAAVSARMEGAVQTLEALRPKLDPDAHQAKCRDLRAWKAPPWLPAGHPAHQRISRARSICDALDGQRDLAFAVRYAERDAALVEAAVQAGRADEAAYHKCAHKGKIYKTLQGSTRPRARAAATALRRACFDRFGPAYLTGHRRAGAGFERRHCYKVRTVADLISAHATKAVVASSQALLLWAKGQCPDPRTGPHRAPQRQ